MTKRRSYQEVFGIDPDPNATTEQMHHRWCAAQAAKRPTNYNDLSAQEQWMIDKDLGILDWNGDPGT